MCKVTIDRFNNEESPCQQFQEATQERACENSMNSDIFNVWEELILLIKQVT